ncbi:hypothetical protein ASG73_15115 [Janibacter sp. Soil728]|uniref:protein phosphatase 2C domain-containing protein n=1 Tax=Janibacter sp. Soil728 TaxID=1736393 RepID=UPI0006F3C4ED|nr:protein phosphatase 2C domain-containing protein [Janibacter sp. Soil728]KRE35989.1 hypothetical protein ASG73_15115 [Janibacter sp. Soil728]
MGTGGPPVTVQAATLAGGNKNQDRYAYGDGWAFVLDGASSFATVQPEHDGGWYADRLKDALVHELTSRPDDTTIDIVARAIAEAAATHDDPATCPTSTIAMARWSFEVVEVYVLGDSTAALITENDEIEVTDSRLADIAPALRTEYRSRLARGHGFDARHLELLQRLQAQQATLRNRDGGYWIAGADPNAARHRVAHTRRTQEIASIVLATDGAAQGLRYNVAPSWGALTSMGLDRWLRLVQQVEARDTRGSSWPRSKPSDDKTVVVIEVTRPT